MGADGYRFVTLLEQPTRVHQPPSGAELRAIGQLGLDLGRAGRLGALSQIADHLGVPAGGWPGSQSKLFDNNDGRVFGLITLLSRPRVASTISGNLAPVARFSDISPMLSLATTQREHSSALYAAGQRRVDSFWEGGLDHLWPERNRLGLPPSVVNRWKPIRPYPNPDAHLPLSQRVPDVQPAWIPASDQLLIYAAQINASFQRFRARLASLNLRVRATRVGNTVWQALCFLAPAGVAFEPGRSLAGQVCQRFGARGILDYLVSTSARNEIDLDRVFRDVDLNKSAWVKSAKVRAIECLFLERLLTTVRDLKLAIGR